MTINKILIGIDESKQSEKAAIYGFDIARKFNASVGLVNIVEPIIIPETMDGIDPLMGAGGLNAGIEDMEIIDLQKKQSGNIIEHTIKQLAGDIQVTRFTEYGSTASSIVECGKEFGADLIVIGTHSRSGLDRLLMGSVAEHVVRHSEVPVLVVPFSS